MNQTQNVKLTAEISATSKGLVEALQKASGAINETSQNWKSRFATLKDSTSTISQSVKNLADLVSQVGNVDMDVEGMDKVKTSIADVTGAFTQVKGQVDDFVTKLSEMKLAASEIGMPIEEYQRFSDAVKNSGLSMSEASGMIQSMKKQILDLANGVPEAKDMFSKLGLTVEQLSSNTMTANFDAIVQALQSVVQPAEGARASMDMFKTSMEHAIRVSQEYNKLLVEQTNNAYATDKDVQNAISLSNAIAKLGEQLGAYTGTANGATSANSSLSHSIQELWDSLKGNENVLNSLLVSYSNYVDSLKNGATSTLNASQALDVLKNQAKEVLDAVRFSEAGLSDGFNTDEMRGKVQQLVDFLSSAKERIQDEITSVRTIMEQRLNAGAPIDTSELEVAFEHIQSIKTAIETIKSTSGTLIELNPDTNKMLTEMNDLLEASTVKFQILYTESANQNLPIALENGRKAADEFSRKLEEVQRNLRNGLYVNIDTSSIEKAKQELDSLIPSTVDAGSQMHENAQKLSSDMSELIGKAEKLNKEIKRGVPIWSPITSAVNGLKDSVAKLGTVMTDGFRKGKGDATGFKGVLNGVAGAIREAWEHMTRLKHETQATSQAGGNLGGTMKQVAGQLLGMGSKVAIIVKGFRELGKMISVYVLDPLRKANEEMRKMQQWQTDNQVKVAQNNYKRFEELENALRQYHETLKQFRKSGSAVDAESLRVQQRDLMIKYGVEINPRNEEAALRENFDWARNSRRDALLSEIQAIEKLNKALDEEYKDRESYWKNDFGASIEQKMQGKQRMVEIRKEQGSNNDRIAELREQLRQMNHENRYGDLRMSDAAEMRDERRKALEKAEEDERKARENQARILEEANRKLQEWSNSINDNERQKNLRVIMSKYEDAVNAGIKEEDARKIAIQAINEMLKKEREEEEKKNRELLDAVNQKIEQYKNAYREYAIAQREIKDAQREYAQTQKELARENKAERLQKRRERLQKRMSTFGFTPYEGFRLNESNSSRLRRRRNVELDKSISEKMTRSEAGERVHWTKRERDRIKDFEKLQKKDKQLEAAQKQMEAAEKQRNAAEALKSAADAIRNAFFGASDSKKNLGNASKELREATGKRMTTSTRGNGEKVFGVAKNRGLRARGAGSAFSQTQRGYNQQLDTLHNDLRELNRRVFVVK